MSEPGRPMMLKPGAMLRRQRQHIDWTVEEIANALCLSPDLIKALEDDDYVNMGGSTFTLGYLRAYARLVGIDIEDAIVSHRDEIPEYIPEPDNIPGDSRRRGGRARSSRRNLWLGLAVLLALGVIAGILLWPDPVANPSRTDELALDSEDDPASGASSTGVVFTAPRRFDRVDGVDMAKLREAVVLDRPLPLNLVLADIAPGAGPGAIATVQPMSADDARRHLVLLFDEGSWADVRDAAGRRLLSQTVSAGSSVDLVGEPPFTVFLGNAGGVRVKYQGRIQAYSQTKKGLFARFTVGQEQ